MIESYKKAVHGCCVMTIQSKEASTVAVLFDERSMVSLNTYGEAAKNIAITAHSGRHGEETLGGIPIMIILGDDCQLPPQIEKGAFDIISGNNNRSGK